MIKIINNLGEVLELDDDAAIPYEKNSTLFNEEGVFIQDLTYPGKAPLTPNNKKFIGGGHRVESANDNYELVVSLYSGQSLVCSGMFSYKITSNEIDYVIKPNYAAVAKLAKDYNLPNIRFNDALIKPSGTSFAQYMNATAYFPNDYPCVFFPIENKKMFEEQTETNSFQQVNFYSLSSGFVTSSPLNQPDIKHFEAPYFKLNYVISKICDFLGFTAIGNIFVDEDMLKRVIYSRIAVRDQQIDEVASSNPRPSRPKTTPDAYIHYNSNIYLPDFSAHEFLKAIAARYHLLFDWNFGNKTVSIDTFESVINGESGIVDISEYVESISEIKTPEEKGFSISLEPDESDEAFLVQTDPDSEDKTAIPTNVIKIANGEKAVVLKCSTLKAAPRLQPNTQMVMANQILQDVYGRSRVTVSNSGSGARPRPVRGSTRFPIQTGVGETPPEPETFRNAIRIVKYEGMKQIPGIGYYFPNSTPDELNEKDAAFYNFSNNAKQLKIVANIPQTLLPKLGMAKLISFVSKEGFYTTAVQKKQSCDIKKGSYIKVLFEVLQRSSYPNKYEVLPGTLADTTEKVISTITAIFPKDQIIPFEIWLLYTPEGQTTSVYEKKSEHVLTESCNQYGLGGTTVIAEVLKKQSHLGQGTFYIRFYQQKPLWFETTSGVKGTMQNGVGFDFVAATGGSLLFKF